jgi:hypothetical protein
LTELAVLPDHVPGWIHQHDPVVRRPIGGLRDHAGRGAGPGHEGQRADALGVIHTDHRIAAEVIRSETERPDDIAARRGLDDPVIELVGDEDIARIVEMAPVVPVVFSKTGGG